MGEPFLADIFNPTLDEELASEWCTNGLESWLITMRNSSKKEGAAEDVPRGLLD